MFNIFSHNFNIIFTFLDTIMSFFRHFSHINLSHPHPHSFHSLSTLCFFQFLVTITLLLFTDYIFSITKFNTSFFISFFKFNTMFFIFLVTTTLLLFTDYIFFITKLILFYPCCYCRRTFHHIFRRRISNWFGNVLI